MENKEVVTVKPRSARRRFSAQFKLELVEQALRSDVSLSAVALANGINANQLARWRRLYLRDEAPGALVPVVVSETMSPPMLACAPSVVNTPLGEIEWRHGDTCLVVRGSVDVTALRTLISQTLASVRGA